MEEQETFTEAVQRGRVRGKSWAIAHPEFRTPVRLAFAAIVVLTGRALVKKVKK